jgi:hypothetical protein
VPRSAQLLYFRACPAPPDATTGRAREQSAPFGSGATMIPLFGDTPHTTTWSVRSLASNGTPGNWRNPGILPLGPCVHAPARHTGHRRFPANEPSSLHRRASSSWCSYTLPICTPDTRHTDPAWAKEVLRTEGTGCQLHSCRVQTVAARSRGQPPSQAQAAGKHREDQQSSAFVCAGRDECMQKA